MPFQDVDEVSTSEPRRTTGGLEKVVRKVFIEDWNLKLLSLGITLVLWLVVTGQNQPVTAHVSVQLNFIRPQSLEISNDPPKTVDVMLTGSRNKLDNLSSLDLVATVDITDQRGGERVLRLADKAQIVLPQGVRIDGFQPSAIAIRLEPIIQRELVVEPKIEGKPVDGYEVYSVRPSKITITVRGPESRVNALQKAQTETIWLNGHKETFVASNVAIDVSDPKIDLPDPILNIEIVIGEKRVEKGFSDVPVSTTQGTNALPATASVIVLGSASALEKLRVEDLKVVVDSVTQTPTLQLPQVFQGAVTLKSLQPSKFVTAK
jgi:YbbR domain-containing protein